MIEKSSDSIVTAPPGASSTPTRTVVGGAAQRLDADGERRVTKDDANRVAGEDPHHEGARRDEEKEVAEDEGRRE